MIANRIRMLIAPIYDEHLCRSHEDRASEHVDPG